MLHVVLNSSIRLDSLRFYEGLAKVYMHNITSDIASDINIDIPCPL